jgi:hypothetical protein
MLGLLVDTGAGARGMAEIAAVLAHWQVDMRRVREGMYRAARGLGWPRS